MGEISVKPKILFVYDHKYPELWMDGLYMALLELEKDFEIDKYNLEFPPEKIHREYDFILGWGAFGSPAEIFISKEKTKKGLCIAGYANPYRDSEKYDVLFYENKWARDYLHLHTHPNIIHAFGVNTEIYFKPDFPTPIVFDYIGVGAFASWKRWEKMKDKKGVRLVIGEYQHANEQESMGIIKDLVSNGVMVSPMVNAYDLSNMYQWSRKAFIPANIIGGGERAVLEARACGLEVEIEDDNPKLQELLEGPIYDYKYYAKQLKKGILSVL